MNFRDPITGESELYARLPKPGRRFIGLTRTTLQNLGDDGFIEIIEVRRPGRSRGLKLIFLPSLFDYLDGLRPSVAANSQQKASTIPMTDTPSPKPK
jgi:hypothetical protein